MEDRRNFLKLLGLGSAAVVGASGEVEVVHSDRTNPLPVPKVAGRTYDKEKWEGPMRDVVSAVLYDRLDVSKFEKSLRFFDRGWANNRGPEETNVYSAMKLDPPTLFQANAIGITFGLNSNPKNIGRILDSYKLHLWLGQKHYADVPLVEAFGPPNSDPTAPFKTLFKMDLPIVIAYDHAFHLELVGSVPYVDEPEVTMWGVMHGRMARGIQ